MGSMTQPLPSALNGKRIVIIGGTSGLGLSAAQAFVNEGARVVIVGRNPETGQSALNSLGPTTAKLILGDAGDPKTTVRAIEACVESFGALDGLYHVAGGSGRKYGDGPLHQITDEGWKTTIDWNLTSIFYSNRAAVNQFLRQGGGGCILNMGSVLGYSPSPRYFSTHAYAATKSAIIGMTKSSAAYYAAQNIRFNVIAPALVETPMAQRAAQNDEILGFIHYKQPLDGGRIGVPSDLDGAAVLFMSDAGKFITGQVLAVDGGWTVSEGVHPKN